MKTLVVFTEEMSAKAMLDSFLPRLLPNWGRILCIEFEGKHDLEKQLPIKLRGWRTPNTAFVILRDQDQGDCHTIKQTLRDICDAANKPDVLIRIACRELEAWYFGDLAAVETGLGIEGLVTLQSKAKYRSPDDIVNPSAELKKITKMAYRKVGGSRQIGHHLSIDNNHSTSFRNFVRGIRRVSSS